MSAVTRAPVELALLNPADLAMPMPDPIAPEHYGANCSAAYRRVARLYAGPLYRHHALDGVDVSEDRAT